MMSIISMTMAYNGLLSWEFSASLVKGTFFIFIFVII